MRSEATTSMRPASIRSGVQLLTSLERSETAAFRELLRCRGAIRTQQLADSQLHSTSGSGSI